MAIIDTCRPEGRATYGYGDNYMLYIGGGESGMNFEEKITGHIQELPDSKRTEAPDFMEYLRDNTEERS